MFVDANEVEDGAAFQSDVCLIGAGAAGITLALALAERGLDVSLVESGGFTPDPRTQSLTAGVTAGIDYPLTYSRLRYFGGSTNHWGGLCRALDDSDFAPRAWVEESGWPIARRELDPYYPKALRLVDIAVPHGSTFADLERPSERYPRLLGNGNSHFTSLLWLRSPPTRFGAKFRTEISESERIRCVLRANALEFSCVESGALVTGVKARTLTGRALSFAARCYVLCTGGIENARLLLLSDRVVAGGIGNQHDVVGRYFQEHLGLLSITMVVALPEGCRGIQEEYALRRSADQPGIGRMFGFTTTAQLRERHRLAAFSLNGLYELPAEKTPPDPIEELLPGSAAGRRLRWYQMMAIGEQSPNVQSRVFLSQERDLLGQRKAVLQWKVREQDERNVRESLNLFAAELVKNGRGRLRVRGLEEFPVVTGLAGHHMGTTRMADDPKRGVTDRNAKVHGVANLYIAGSSLFPTSGYANPTLTILALALRLADHLATTVSKGG